MDKLNLKDIQSIEKNILEKFDDFCKQNDLNMFLVDGTLLGAIRHKGFIPWDDDIDVGMTIDDYNKLIRIAKENKKICQFIEILIPLKEEKYVYPYIKVVDTSTLANEKNVDKKYSKGIYIDVFPFSYVGNSKDDAFLLLKKSNKEVFKLFRVVEGKDESLIKNFVKKIYKLIYKIQGLNYSKIIENILKLLYQDKSEYMAVVAWPTNKIYSKNMFKEFTKVEFEGKMYNAPLNYQDYLTDLYGEYMQLPKEEDRISHSFDAYRV